MTDPNRKAFEAWFQGQFTRQAHYLHRDTAGNYSNQRAFDMFLGWQAAMSLRLEAAKESPIKVGQVWQEIDSRPGTALHRVVVGFADDGRIMLDYATGCGRVTKAKPERFNGKRGGYKLIKDAP